MKDPAGLPIVGVSITVTEQRSGWTRGAQTNEAGDYELRGILPGRYAISAEAAGFKKVVNSDLLLYGGQVRRVDLQMELGQVTERVDVKEQASVIETDTASISYKQGNQEIYHLNAQTAGWLTYTLENHPGREARSQVHGGYANQTRSLQDGIDLMSYSQQGRLPQEMVQEISQVSLNAPAEFKHATTVIGSGYRGGNNFHGQVFLDFRHQALNALAVGQTQRLPAKATKQWSFDGSGPVLLPKLYDGRNKTFFRFLYQPASLADNVPQDGFDAPPQALRSGDLNPIINRTGRAINDPLTGQPFAGNIVPASRISPVARNAMELIPLPNLGSPGDLTDNVRFFDQYTESSAWQNYRIDHQLTAKNSFYVSHLRYFRDTLHTADDNPFNSRIDRDATTRAVSVRDTHVFTPRIINEFTFAWNRQQIVAKDGVFRGADLVRRLGINTGERRLPDGLGSPQLVLTTFQSNKAGSIIGGRAAQESVNTDAAVTSFRDSVSINYGRHLVKTGVDIAWQRPYTYAIGAGSFGVLNFTGNYSGNDWADFLLGLPRTATISAPRPAISARHLEMGFFVQDDWKVNGRLTITPGIRLQHYGTPYDASGLYYNFDLDKMRLVVPGEKALAAVHAAYPKTIPIVTAAQAGYPSRLANFRRLLIEPRFGVAWRPIGQGFVVRGGYGIYNVPYARPAAAGAGELLPGRTGGPFGLSESFGPNVITQGIPQLTSENPFPTGPGQVGLQSVTVLPIGTRQNGWPYDQQWNLTVEKALPWAMSVRASYVGSKGTNWPYLRNLQVPQVSSERFTVGRRPYGGSVYSSIMLNDLGGNATYNGLELELTRQFSSGLYLRAWYDYHKSLNDTDGGTFGDSDGVEPEYPYDRSRDKGWQDGVIPHSARLVAVYELPFGRGHGFGGNLPRWVDHVIGGWSVAPLLTIQAQTRYTPTFTGADPSNTGRSSGRPIATCNGNDFGDAPGVMWNRACFSVPANGTLGTASRGSLYGPRVWRTAFNVFKVWKLAEAEPSPYFKFEFYSTNIFNHSNSDSLVSNNIANSAFGQFRVNTVDTRVIYFRARIGF